MERSKILIIDDEQNILDALKRILRDRYEVTTATSGKEGLKLLGKESFEVLIADQRMPGLSGVEFFEKAKELQPDAIRILLTGYADINTVMEAINTGEVYRYLTKPWEIDDFRTTVKQAIETYSLRRSLVEKTEELELSHRQLKKAYKQLEELDEAKSKFLGLISHELRTPLTSILSYSESLLEDLAESEDEALKFYKRINEAADRLNNIVTDIVEFTAIQSGKLAIKKEKADISKIIEKSLDDLKKEIDEKNIKVKYKPKKITVSADKKQMKKVLDKIIHNAVLFNRKNGGISIDISSDNKVIEIIISDTGIGISKDEIETIFTPFIGTDILHHHKGIGLSLPTCKAIIETHGGSIQAKNLKKGTAIHISLPAK